MRPYQVSFRVPGPDEDLIRGTDPDRIGTHSVYKFDNFALVRNQGLQPVEKYSDHQDRLNDIALFDVDDPETLLDGFDESIRLDASEEFTMGLHIETNKQKQENSTRQ